VRWIDPRAPRRSVVAAALVVLVVATLLYAAHVTLGAGGRAHANLWNHWLYDGVIAASGVLCGWRAWAIAADRRAWAAICLAIGLYWFGDLYWNIELSRLSNPPYPSWADAGYLAYYIPLYAGIILLLRARVSKLPVSTWLEGVVGAFALGSVAAVAVFDPVVVSTHGSPAAVATNLAYPTLDVLLLAFVALGFALQGRRAGRAWGLLGLGVFLSGVGDAVYLLQSALGTYTQGGWINALWPASVALIAVAAWGDSPSRPTSPQAEDAPAARLLTAFFAVMIVGVLGLEAVERVPLVAHVLVTLAIVALIGRLALAGRERELFARTRVEARTDSLTGLPNRRHAFEYLDLALEAGGEVAVLLLDLERFKEINDMLGHSAGDELLCEVGVRLAAALPESSLVARLGGDEYVAVLRGHAGRNDAQSVAQHLQDSFQQPFSVDGLLIPVRASIGIGLSPHHACSRTELMRCADIALYQAKTKHTAIEYYQATNDGHTRERLELVAELGVAIDNAQLVLHYQPMLCISKGRVRGVEALVRWQHPSRGLLGPQEFVPLAELHGLMRPLTLAVLDQALRQQHLWRQSGLEIHMAVNLSPTNLMDTRLPDDIAMLLKRHDVAPHLLELEITEDTLIRDPIRTLDVLARLSELGIDFSLDDFGTGYSSLSLLAKLPVRQLKIDRSFVMQMSNSRDNANIVRSTIEMAHRLNLTVVAEGVETAEQLAALRTFGADTAQGYHISRPIPADELEIWLARSIPPTRSTPKSLTA
jgi:diguanylate cyclase (GGDEF)-like protein